MSLMQDIVSIAKDLSLITADMVHCQAEHIAGLYKKTLSKALGWLLMALVAVLLALAGLGWILYSIHLTLTNLVGPVASGIIMGIVLILIAIIVFLIAHIKLKD
jgi:uncharacterized protein (DUF697 family)